MDWYIVRHGYTFGPDQQGGERPIICGSGENPPLVARGRTKARAFAAELLAKEITPKVIYANHLLRTWEHGALIREAFHQHTSAEIPLLLDDSLLELDYGAWAGLEVSGNTPETNQVIAQFGQQVWDDWQQRRIMPQGAPHNWQTTADAVQQRLQDFATQLVNDCVAQDTAVSIGSQGTITYLHSLLPGGMAEAVAAGQLKTAPGNYAHLRFEHNAWQLLAWNQDPS